MLGTPEDPLEMTDLGIALTAAPEAAGSEMFPVRPSLWEQYMHSTALHFCLKERKKKKRERESARSLLFASCSSLQQPSAVTNIQENINKPNCSAGK